MYLKFCLGSSYHNVKYATIAMERTNFLSRFFSDFQLHHTASRICFVYGMHGSKIKKKIANSIIRGVSCKIIQERGISQCYKCTGTISWLTATQSPSLEYPTQNYHTLYMLTRTDFKFALFVNGQSNVQYPIVIRIGFELTFSRVHF